MEWVFEDIRVKLTNTDRVMFPDCGVTKREVLEYYRDVAGLMLPEVRDRAFTMERFAKGIDVGGFFQKHWQKHYPAWIRKVELGQKTVVVYPVCDSAAALVYFANQGGIAMHIWTSRTAAKYPDLLVFNLNPPEGRFNLVRTAALELKTLFDDLDQPTFVKTTGSKGLHVVVPLDGRAMFGEVMALGNRVAKVLCAEPPRQVSAGVLQEGPQGAALPRRHAQRPRGDHHRAVLAARPTGRAAVGADRVGGGRGPAALKPNGFTLRTIRDRLELLGDPWSNLRHTVASVDDADAALDRHAADR